MERTAIHKSAMADSVALPAVTAASPPRLRRCGDSTMWTLVSEKELRALRGGGSLDSKSDWMLTNLVVIHSSVSARTRSKASCHCSSKSCTLLRSSLTTGVTACSFKSTDSPTCSKCCILTCSRAVAKLVSTLTHLLCSKFSNCCRWAASCSWKSLSTFRTVVSSSSAVLARSSRKPSSTTSRCCPSTRAFSLPTSACLDKSSTAADRRVTSACSN
mmetsp:Transcript_46934/g.86022  ORF Transcript_46934/g.86022 Transcript_46934/m.86022 type:complete len:216 (-) Transcript_46934:296-943(-)